MTRLHKDNLGKVLKYYFIISTLGLGRYVYIVCEIDIVWVSHIDMQIK